jgi:hypothetical protein
VKQPLLSALFAGWADNANLQNLMLEEVGISKKFANFFSG